MESHLDMMPTAKLLLVEDNPADVWLLREALRLARFNVDLTLAKDGVEAIRHLHRVEETRTDWPDLILLDLNLPRRNGREVLADIQRSDLLRDIPVVILSSSQSEEERKQAFGLNASGFFVKPSGLPAYVELVKEIATYWRANGAELKRTA